MATKTKTSGGLTGVVKLTVVAAILVIAASQLARGFSTGSGTRTRDDEELTVAVTIYPRFDGVTPRVQIHVYENEKKTHDREHTSNWSRVYHVSPGGKIEVKAYYVDAVIEAHCVIFDTNGHVHDDDDVIFLRNELSRPATCVVSIP